MMREQDKDLAAFEKYLFSFMNDASEGAPLTNDEVVAILQNYGTPAEVAQEEKEQIVKIMKEAHERWAGITRKRQNPKLIHSLGELFELFCEWQNTPAASLARLLNLTEEQFEDYRKDRISPVKLGKERILNFAALAGLAIEDIVDIVDKTIKLLQLKPTTNFAGGYTRVYKDATEPERLRVREDAAKELLLKLDEQKEPSQPENNWEALRQELLREGTEVIPSSGETSLCITIRSKSQRHFANFILQQI